MIKLVFADRDMFYISRVVMKFAEELDYRADISVITEEACAKETFGSPFSADLLLISEEMLPLFRKECFSGKVIILREEEENCNSAVSDSVYKYNSVTQILEQVKRGAPEVFRTVTEEKNGCLLSAVYPVNGYGGGAGRDIAKKLQEQGRSAVYVNAAWLQIFQYELTDRTPVPEKFLDCFRNPESGNIDRALKQLIRRETYEYFPPFQGNITALGLDFDVYLRIAETLKNSGRYEFIVLDIEGGLDTERFRIFSEADQVLFAGSDTEADDFAYELLTAQLADPDSGKYLHIVLKGDPAEDGREIGKTVKILTERQHA